jgi:hypothetical protein
MALYPEVAPYPRLKRIREPDAYILKGKRIGLFHCEPGDLLDSQTAWCAMVADVHDAIDAGGVL